MRYGTRLTGRAREGKGLKGALFHRTHRICTGFPQPFPQVAGLGAWKWALIGALGLFIRRRG